MPANKRNLILAASAVLVLLSALVAYAFTVGDTPLMPEAPQALPAVPGWVPWAAGVGVPLVALVALVGAVLLHRRQFWRGIESGWGGPPAEDAWDAIGRVWALFSGWVMTKGDVDIRLVALDEPSSALANAGKRTGRADATIIPEPWWEWRWPWLTRLLKGRGPVWLVVVRYDPARPEWSAELVAHELGAHLWPYLQGRGWNYDPVTGEEGHDAEAEEVERRLHAAVRGE